MPLKRVVYRFRHLQLAAPVLIATNHAPLEKPSRPKHIAHRGFGLGSLRLVVVANGGSDLPGTQICTLDYLWAGDLRRAYDDNGSPTASNTSIAIFTDGNVGPVITDLRQYESINGERQVPVTVVNVDLPSNDESGFVEYQMDTQTSTGIAGDVKTPGSFASSGSSLALVTTGLPFFCLAIAA